MTMKQARMPLQKSTTNKITPRTTRRGKNWVLAVDPFSDLEMHGILPLVRRLAGRLHAVYVLAPASLNWTGEFSGPWMKKYLPVVKAKMAEVFAQSDITSTIVSCKASGQRASVKALLAHARKLEAECLVLSTHARQGLERLAMGSFAETLILSSKIPVLVINPSQPIPSSIRRILVPTNLSRKSEAFASTVADFAKKQDAEIILYHKEIDPLDPIIQQGVYSLGGGWVSTQEFADEDRQSKTEALERLQSRLTRKGVTNSHVLDSFSGDLVAGIERAAQDHGADMIAVLTESGPWSAALLGSVARGLVRSSPIPVMVRHS